MCLGQEIDPVMLNETFLIVWLQYKNIWIITITEKMHNFRQTHLFVACTSKKQSFPTNGGNWQLNIQHFAIHLSMFIKNRLLSNLNIKKTIHKKLDYILEVEYIFLQKFYTENTFQFMNNNHSQLETK